MTNRNINNYKTGPDGIKLIKDKEKLVLHAYQNVINGVKDKITIGWGHTGLLHGRPLVLSDVITEVEAEQLFRDDLSSFERTINESVKVPINQHQFDALVTLAYNIGPNAFKTSTLLKLLNKGDFEGAQKQFARWNKGPDGKTVSAGLVKRRAEEAALFSQSKVTIKLDTDGLKKSVNELKDTFKDTGDHVKKTSQVFDDATKIKIAVGLGVGVVGTIVGTIIGGGGGRVSTDVYGQIITPGLTSPAAVNPRMGATQVYAPEITTQVTARDLFEVFNNNKSRLFALIASGVQTDTKLRNTIRSA